LVSGFVGGKLIYIFPKGQRREGEYLRSAGFSFRDYKDCPSLKLAYLRLPLKGPDKIL